MLEAPTSSQEVTIGPALEVSPLDTRTYRSLTLQNQLRVLLVSDSASDKAAASLDVSVGNFSDPNELPGLAHFLEHMLFLGTKKYPEEGSYNAFLAENGGHSNAYTAAEDTNYHFDMLVSDRDPDHPAPRFKAALDRFAQFFIAPLFTESATDRELNAVHSEHQKNLQSDERRMNQVAYSCANPKHPFSKFGTGSKETLCDIPCKTGIDTRAQLLRFYHTKYSANLMNLCVIAPYPLDLLQEWVVDLFSAIPNHEREDPSENYRHIEPLLDEHLGLLFQIESVRDIRILELSWLTPSYVNDYHSKPAGVVSYLLGDEGEGSLLSLLKRRGWCDGLYAGPLEMKTFGYLQVTVTLTNEGVSHIDEIITAVYQYIRMLQRGGIPKWAFDEEARLAEIAFRFRDREEPMPLAVRVASKMPFFAPKEYLSGHFLYKTFDQDKITGVLNMLIPENCNITVAGKFVNGKTDCIEKWYDTPYRVERVCESRVKKWMECDITRELHLPPPNPFIPTDFDIHGEPLPDGEKDTDGPNVIEENDYFEVRHKLDRTFQRPQAKIIMKFMTPLTYLSPWHAVMANMLTSLLEDSLTEFSYPAERAGFKYDLDKTESAFVLVISGYSHRIDVLLDTVVRKMRNFEADPTRFEMQKDIVEREYVNFEKAQPLQHAMYNLNYMLEEPRWHISEYVSCLQNGQISLEGVNKYAKDVLQKMWVTALICGNISKDNAITMVNAVQQTLGYEVLPKSQLQTRRVVQVPKGQDVFFRAQHPNVDDNNSAIEVFFEIGPRGDFADDVRLELLAEILNKPTFHELRTVQQLGYMVFEGVMDNDGIAGVYVIVQSTVADPDDLLERIDKFLKDVREDLLDDMSEDKFNDYVKALVAKKAEPDRTISRQAIRFWLEIDKGFLQFDRRAKEIDALQRLTKEEVVRLFDDCIADKACRRRVVLQVYGNQHPFEKRSELGDGVWDVVDVMAFRRQCPLFPVVGQPCGSSRKR